jgi:ATP-dependent Clp protease ATP-binding subunit ClpC
MYERFTDRARKVMQLANQEALRFNHEYIGTEHILLGLVKEGSGVAANVLKNLDIDLGKVRLEIEKIVQAGPDMPHGGKMPQTPRAKKVIEYSIEEARSLNHNYVGTEHLLLGLIREQDGVAAQVLINLGLKLQDVRDELLNLLGRDQGIRPVEKGLEGARPNSTAVDRFGLDLTELARRGKLSPIVGRKNELERMMLVLCCRTQNNPIVVGPPGVGKWTMVKGLAASGVDYGWPRPLWGRRLVALTVAQMAALTEDREDFERQVTAVVAELRVTQKVIVFIEDLLTLVSNAPMGDFAGRVLRSALVRGQMQCITAATPEQYHAHVATDSLLGRYFQPVHVQPLSKEATLEVLRDRRPMYERYHRVRITDEALQACLELSDAHLPEGYLPGKAISLLDQAGALVRMRNALPPPELATLDSQIARLTEEKKEKVAEQDFDKAAHLRDQTDKLKKVRTALLREWREKEPEMLGTVDKENVAEVLRTMTGGPSA